MGGECLLDRFLPWSAAQRGLQLSREFEHPVTVWAVLFDVLAILLGLLLLIHGGKLNATILFVIGFVCAAAICSAATSAVLGALSTSSCLLLGWLPLVVGLVCGLTVRDSPKTTFFLLGACVGGAIGYYIYSVVHLFLLYLLLIPAVAGGCLGLWWQARILTAATTIIGAFFFMLGTTYLVLVPIDARYARWLTPQSAQPDRYTLVPLVGAAGLVLSGGILQRLWERCEEGSSGGVFLDVPILNHLQSKKSRWQRVKEWWSPPKAWWRVY